MVLIMTRNFQYTGGKTLGVNFLGTLLPKVSEILDDKIFIISCDDTLHNSEVEEVKGTCILRVPSISMSSPQLQNDLWLKKKRISPMKDLVQRNIDSMRMIKRAFSVLPEAKSVHWFRSFTPFLNVFRIISHRHAVKNYASIFGYSMHAGIHDRLLKESLKDSLHGLDNLTVNTASLEDFVSRDLAFPRHKIRRIPLGVDLSLFRPPSDKDRLKEAEGLEAQHKVVSWFGPIYPSEPEDFYHMVNCMHRVQRTMPSTFIFAFKFGVPPDVHLPNSNVRFYDKLNGISKILDVSDLVVLPFSHKYRWVSHQPLTIIEALASGVPVITMNYPGLNETVIDAFNGILVERIGDLSDAVLTLCRREDKLEEMSRNARMSAEQRYDISKVARIYANLWRA